MNDILAKNVGVQLLMMQDYKKAAKYLFDMIKNNILCENNDIKNYLISLMEVISSHDDQYAQDMVLHFTDVLVPELKKEVKSEKQ